MMPKPRTPTLFALLVVWVCQFTTPIVAQVAGPRSREPVQADGHDVPIWTTDARWYYLKIPRFRNGDKENDPQGTLPWAGEWPPLESEKSVPTDASGNPIPCRLRRYGGDLRGVIQGIPYLKKLGVNAICLSPPFLGEVERRIAQVDLRHVDDNIGVNGGFGQAQHETADPKSWVWTSSDLVLRELIHAAHEQGIRVVLGGVFSAVMSAGSPPSELERYYLSATKRWMDPDGDGNPLDGIDGWIASLEEGSLRQFDDKLKAFWSRWRDEVRRINPDAVVVASGTLSLGQLKSGPFDVALHHADADPVVEFFGVRKNRISQSKAMLDFIAASDALSPVQARWSNMVLLSGGHLNGRLLTETAASEPLRDGRRRSPGPVPDDAARTRWKLATILHHFLPGAPVTWYGDEVGMFGGPSEFADAPMWWSDSIADSTKSNYYRKDFFSLVQWLHHLRSEYPALRKGNLRSVLMDDANKILAISRSIPDQEVILVVNYGGSKQLVMLPVGKPGEMAGVRSPHLVPPRGLKAPTANAPGDEFPALSVAGARQFVGPEGKIRMWLDPMSVRVVFLGTLD